MFARSLFLVSLALSAHSALALVHATTVNQIPKCHIEGLVEITVDTQIPCDGDFAVSEGTVIHVAAGRTLQIFVHGQTAYSTGGLKVVLEEGADLLIQTWTASGALNVQGGEVFLDYGSLGDTYQAEIHPGFNAKAKMVLNGVCTEAETGKAEGPCNG